MELLDVYNHNGEKTGKIIPRGTKDEEFGEDEHTAVSIIYIENSEGKLLIQKSKTRGVFSATGGHISHNETPEEAIIRETKEELGIDISKDNIISLGHICVDFPVRFIFYLKKDIDIKKLKLNKKEVESVQYLSIKEINKLLDQNLMHKAHYIVLERVTTYINNLNGGKNE